MESNGRVFQDHEKIRLTKDGVFLSNGEEIEHERTVDAYHRFLDRDEEGWFVAIGKDFKRIEVEDTGRFVRSIEWRGKGADEWVELVLADGARERLDPTTLVYRPGRLVCKVRGGRDEARFLRAPYAELLLRALDEGPREPRDGERFAIRLGGRFYTL